ncbi:MAG: hypothetical protein AB1567_12090 [bacterium]
MKATTSWNLRSPFRERQVFELPYRGVDEPILPIPILAEMPGHTA